MIKIKNRLWLRISLGFGVLLLGCLTGILLHGLQPADPEQPTQTTEATLPEPEKSIFTPEDFAYEGDYLTCLTGESILGIDVSSYQKDIDWEQVKAASVEFVIIRGAYRGYGSAGRLTEDKKAQENYLGAKAAGLKVGAYIFSQAVTVEEAGAEALFLLDVTRDWELDMPLVFDWEQEEIYRNSFVDDSRLVTDMALAFCRHVEEAGREAMVYFNSKQSRQLFQLEELTDYGFWLAMYSDVMNYEYKVDMWQYSCTGAVPGISGNVDLNLYFPYE